MHVGLLAQLLLYLLCCRNLAIVVLSALMIKSEICCVQMDPYDCKPHVDGAAFGSSHKMSSEGAAMAQQMPKAICTKAKAVA